MKKPTVRAVVRARKRYNKWRRRLQCSSYRWDQAVRYASASGQVNNLVFGWSTRDGWEWRAEMVQVLGAR